MCEKIAIIGRRGSGKTTRALKEFEKMKRCSFLIDDYNPVGKWQEGILDSILSQDDVGLILTAQCTFGKNCSGSLGAERLLKFDRVIVLGRCAEFDKPVLDLLSNVVFE